MTNILKVLVRLEFKHCCISALTWIKCFAPLPVFRGLSVLFSTDPPDALPPSLSVLLSLSLSALSTTWPPRQSAPPNTCSHSLAHLCCGCLDTAAHSNILTCSSRTLLCSSAKLLSQFHVVLLSWRALCLLPDITFGTFVSLLDSWMLYCICYLSSHDPWLFHCTISLRIFSFVFLTFFFFFFYNSQH